MVGQINDVYNIYNAYKSIPNGSRLVNEDYAVLFNVVSISDLPCVTKFKGSTLSVLSSWFLYCIKFYSVRNFYCYDSARRNATRLTFCIVSQPSDVGF